MKKIEIIVDILGVGLIIGLAFLLKDMFPTPAVMTLDIIIAIFVFIVFMRADIGIFNTAKNFEEDNQAVKLGTAIWASNLYGILALAGIVLGLFIGENGTPFKWQIFYQLLLIFFLITVYILVRTSSNTMQHVVAEAEAKQQPRANLISLGQELDFTVNTVTNINESTKDEINKFVSNIKFITPSRQPIAQQLEQTLMDEISKIKMALMTGNEQEINQHLAVAISLLEQRMKTY